MCFRCFICLLQVFYLDVVKLDLACMHVDVRGAQIDTEWSGKRNDVGSVKQAYACGAGVQTPVSVRTSGRLISPASDSSAGLLGFGPSAVELKSTGP